MTTEVGKDSRRMFIVTMNSKGSKWKLVGKGGLITQSKDENLSNVYLNPDLTKTQRDGQYRFHAEQRERVKNGEDVVVEGQKVVPRRK